MTRPITDMRWIADNCDEMCQVDSWTFYHFDGTWGRGVRIEVNHLRKIMSAFIFLKADKRNIDIDMDEIYYVDDFKHLLRMIGRKDDDRD